MQRAQSMSVRAALDGKLSLGKKDSLLVTALLQVVIAQGGTVSERRRGQAV